MYAHMKTRLQDDQGYNSPLSIMAAGVIASIPGAPIAVPFDVIKTRMQVCVHGNKMWSIPYELD